MMNVLVAIAVKSLLIAGLTLGILQLMKRHSAAERSWVAHMGLLALVLMALAPLVLPNWKVEAPALLGQAPRLEATVQDSPPLKTVASAPLQHLVVPQIVPTPDQQSRPSISTAAAAEAIYAVPAAILLLITFIALSRLIALQARADVLVDGHWLSALARAQRRMGFKHGTALLTSNELSSPISWGLMRPVILLNSRAVEATGEAEAIIAHELAHVARMDWAKLLLARIATALFWFNPLVWLLAREAHQLREEAADDSVLAADIVDTDYAQLLVGVARHECPGLLLGAHGVAPSKNSLARRVARVLDGKSVRGPAARSFALGVFAGAALIAAPLAALTLTPGSTGKGATIAQGRESTRSNLDPQAGEVPTDLPHIIASGVSASMATVASAVATDSVKAHELAARQAADAVREQGRAQLSREARIDAAKDAVANARDALDEAADTVREEQRSAVVQAMTKGRIDTVVAMQAAGIEPAYVNALRSAQWRLRRVDVANLAGLQSLGVTPDYARDLASAGLSNLSAEELAEARVIGLTGDYVRGLAAAGMPLNFRNYIELRVSGVPVQSVQAMRKAGYPLWNPNSVIEIWSTHAGPQRGKAIPAPPPPPTPPRTRPTNDGSDDDGG